MPVININTDASVVYAAKLERISRAALPVAIRRTLNATAMDVKKVTMPDEVSKTFISRKRTFWSATSRVEYAQGLDINAMKSIAGFMAPEGKKESGHATKDLEEQEEGGAIDKRAFIATDAGRTALGNVRDALTMARIKRQIFDANNSNLHGAKNSKEAFILSAIYAGKGGFVIGTDKNNEGSRALMRIASVHRVLPGENRGVRAGNTVVNSKEVYSVHGKRKAHVKATHFMKKASEASGAKMERIFAEQAERAINGIK